MERDLLLQQRRNWLLDRWIHAGDHEKTQILSEIIPIDEMLEKIPSDGLFETNFFKKRTIRKQISGLHRG